MARRGDIGEKDRVVVRHRHRAPDAAARGTPAGEVVEIDARRRSAPRVELPGWRCEATSGLASRSRNRPRATRGREQAGSSSCAAARVQEGRGPVRFATRGARSSSWSCRRRNRGPVSANSVATFRRHILDLTTKGDPWRRISSSPCRATGSGQRSRKAVKRAEGAANVENFEQHRSAGQRSTASATRCRRTRLPRSRRPTRC